MNKNRLLPCCVLSVWILSSMISLVGCIAAVPMIIKAMKAAMLERAQISDRADNAKKIDDYIDELTDKQKEDIKKARDYFLIPLDAAIIFAPVGALVPVALRAVMKGGTVVCAGIHMSDIPSFPYDILWGERTVRSVANLTRRDGEEFLALAPKIPVNTEISCYPLTDANEALSDLRDGRLQGAAVLLPEGTTERVTS